MGWPAGRGHDDDEPAGDALEQPDDAERGDEHHDEQDDGQDQRRRRALDVEPVVEDGADDALTGLAGLAGPRASSMT